MNVSNSESGAMNGFKSIDTKTRKVSIHLHSKVPELHEIDFTHRAILPSSNLGRKLSYDLLFFHRFYVQLYMCMDTAMFK